MPVGKNSDPVRSTFPIPAAKLHARKWKTALGSPITWAPYLPVVGAFAFLDVPAMVSAGLAGLVTAGVFAYWKTHGRKLEGKLLEELISESNAEQDKILVKNARSLLRRGFPDYASTLGSFLERKQRIEKAIHGSGELTTGKKEVETLVDAVVFGVSDQLHRLADFDDRLNNTGGFPLSDEQRSRIQTAREEVSTRVHDAFDILEETWNNLGDILNPASALDQPRTEHHALDHAIARLRQEREIAQRVRERMETDWGERFGSDPGPGRSSGEETGQELES